MADQYTPLPIKTKTAGDVDVDIVSGTVGLLESGTLAAVNNLVKGTITRLEGGSVVVTTGTIGDLDTIGTVGVLEAGSLNLVKAGTITKVEGGTINNIASGSIVVTAGTVDTTLVLDAGTIDLLKAGTLSAINNIVKGTITKLEGGTLNNLATGTVTIGVGTVTTGSLSNVATVGTIKNLDGGTVTVSNPSGGPSSAKFAQGSSAALAAGATGTVAFTAITNAKTGQLDRVLVSSSVPIRAEIQSVDDPGTGTITAGVVFTSAAMLNERFDPPFDTYFTRTSTGTAKFQAVIKNMDNVLAADVYATGFWDEITT
jgi:hypothetical protein